MSLLPRTRVGRKIALAVGVPVILAALAGVSAAWLRAESIVRHDTAEEAAALADLVATSFGLVDPAAPPQLSPGHLHPHRQAIDTLRADFTILDHVRELRVVDRKGVVRWSRRLEEQGTAILDAGAVLSAPPRGLLRPDAGEYLRPLGGMECARCHAGDAFRVGAVQVVMGSPRMDGDVRALFRGVYLGIGILLVVLVAATAASMRAFVTRPLDRLAQVMLRAEKGDFLTRAPPGNRDEIGALARAFNQMVSRITELKVAEIETSREMEGMQRELALKAELERQHAAVEEANRALERRVSEVTLLLDIAQSLNSTLELGEILSLVTEMVGLSLGVQQFSVMLLDEARGELVLRESWGFERPEELANYRIPVGAGAAGLAAENREPLYLPDVGADPRFLRGPQDPREDASLLSIPMICKEKVVGVLNFLRAGRDAFSENDVTVLKLLGSQAAMAVLNARLYSETKELTFTDTLTGVFNRRHLFARLEMELARAHRFQSKVAVIMVDIDHFKHFNDSAGHPAGDRILAEVASLLSRTVRKVDAVARYGGEEFTVVLPQIGRAEALEVAEKLRRAVERTRFDHGDGQPGGRLTISLGVANYPDDAPSLAKLIEAADRALFASKRAGRNRVTAFAPNLGPAGATDPSPTRPD